MNAHFPQQGGETANALAAAFPDRPWPDYEILTFAQFAERYPAWTEPALRNLRFKAKERYSTHGVISGNGLIEAGAFIKIGTRVRIVVPKFFLWAQEQNEVRR